MLRPAFNLQAESELSLIDADVKLGRRRIADCLRVRAGKDHAPPGRHEAIRAALLGRRGLRVQAHAFISFAQLLSKLKYPIIPKMRITHKFVNRLGSDGASILSTETARGSSQKSFQILERTADFSDENPEVRRESATTRRIGSSQRWPLSSVAFRPTSK